MESIKSVSSVCYNETERGPADPLQAPGPNAVCTIPVALMKLMWL
jgi:hypothetical protein